MVKPEGVTTKKGK